MTSLFSALIRCRFLLGDFDDALVGIDLDPVSGPYEREWILVEIGHRRCVSHDRAERDLGRHFVEQHRRRRRAREARDVKLARPSGRTLRPRKYQHLALEALAAKLVPGLDDGAGPRVDAAPAGDPVLGHERLALGAAADHLPAVQHDLFHNSLPNQRPLTAAWMQSAVVPNQACTPMIAGR